VSSAREMFTDLFSGRDRRTCEVCGNEYYKAFETRMAGETHVAGYSTAAPIAPNAPVSMVSINWRTALSPKGVQHEA
jgi:hypothetical protein